MNSFLTREATRKDIPSVLALQAKFHVSVVPENARANGFVTTLLTAQQLEELIAMHGLYLCEETVSKALCGYVVAASWPWLSQWPIFKYMAEELPTFAFEGVEVTARNSFQYGPICIDEAYRGSPVLPALYEAVRTSPALAYPVAVTFINQKNERSFAAHTRKLGVQVIDTFSFNDNTYYRLAFAMAGRLSYQ